MSTNAEQYSTGINIDYTETINKLYELIRTYHEIIVNRGNFVDRKPEEIERSKAIFQAMGNILEELKKIDKFEERAESLANICEDIVKRYNSIREEEFDRDLKEVDDFINSYGSKSNFTFTSYGEKRQPSSEEIEKRVTPGDISKINEKYNKENIRIVEEIKLSNDIDKLINAVDTIINKFLQESTLELQQNQSKQEAEIVNNLPATIQKNKGFGAIISKFIERIKLFFKEPNVVATVDYKEVTGQRESSISNFRESLSIDENEMNLSKNKSKNDFTFLTQEQCFGSDKLDIFEKRGTKAAITDFSILLGGWVDRDSDYWHIDSDSSLEGRTGYYWTRSDDGANDARVVDGIGNRDCNNVSKRNGGARLALSFSSIGLIPTNGESGKRARDGILEVEYGYYPQKAVSRDMQERLERAYLSRKYIKNKK